MRSRKSSLPPKAGAGCGWRLQRWRHDDIGASANRDVFVLVFTCRSMPASINPKATGVERCVSCDAPLSGAYCARCGERVLEPEALTLRHFLVHTVAHELLNVDGTLWRTLRL